jgi:hypothetical protein
MTTVSQYVGRTVDMLAFPEIPGSSAHRSAQVLVAPGFSGAVVTGIRKLFQRYLLELLTEVGSMPYSPNRGTAFMTRLRYGAVRTTQELYAVFVESETDVRVNLQLEESQNDPADERYESSQLLNATLSAAGDSVSLTIQVVSLAGDEITVIQPLTISVI